jgi:hypothetical protein
LRLSSGGFSLLMTGVQKELMEGGRPAIGQGFEKRDAFRMGLLAPVSVF